MQLNSIELPIAGNFVRDALGWMQSRAREVEHSEMYRKRGSREETQSKMKTQQTWINQKSFHPQWLPPFSGHQRAFSAMFYALITPFNSSVHHWR
jgi:hypothetical protein